MDTKPLIRKGLAVGIILLFIGVSVAPSINQSVVTASIDKDLTEIKFCLYDKGCLTEEITFISDAETTRLKEILTNLYNTLRKGNKTEIDQCYSEIEENKILGLEMVETIAQYERSLDEPEWNESLVLGLANSSLRIMGLLFYMAFLNTNSPLWMRIFALLFLSPFFILKYLPPFNFLSLVEMFFIESGSFHLKSKKGSWDASCTVSEPPFGVALICYTGIIIMFSTDLEAELFPSEFLFVCGYAKYSQYLQYITPINYFHN